MGEAGFKLLELGFLAIYGYLERGMGIGEERWCNSLGLPARRNKKNRP